jgi:predicted phosphodiesterase
MDVKKLLLRSREEAKSAVLHTLIESAFPVSVKELENRLRSKGIVVSNIDRVLKDIETEGYDLKYIYSGRDRKVGLVRYGTFDKDRYYKVLGTIEFPILITSDWHICSRGFSVIAFNKLVEDCTTFKVKTMLHAGDLIQGLGVYSVEAMDVTEPSIDAQEELAIKLLNKIPKSVRKVLIIGNHEEKLKGSWKVGHDPIKYIASNVENCEYFGHMAKLMASKWSILMVHGAGAPSYAWSYMIQKILRNLVERPTFLIAGHLHMLGIWSFPPNNYTIMAGTLQRENSYLLQKGIQSVIGWVIVRGYDGKRLDAVVRTPEVF